MEATLIAPCGFNCGICKSHLRKYKSCLGCNHEERKKQRCPFQLCETIKTNQSGFCFDCEQFPCKKLKSLDTKHKEREDVSMIENLLYIKKYGMQDFLKSEEEKWKCPECGGVICVGALNISCSSCGLEIRKSNRPTKKGNGVKKQRGLHS